MILNQQQAKKFSVRSPKRSNPNSINNEKAIVNMPTMDKMQGDRRKKLSPNKAQAIETYANSYPKRGS